MDKNEKLHEALGRLSAQEAATLAQAVELQRSLGTETLPTNAILDVVRPRLRDARPRRHPTVFRLICNAFDEFLTDRRDEPRIAGLIPRKSVGPWRAVLWHIAKDEIAALTIKLRSTLAKDPRAPLDALEREIQQSAARWAALVVADLNKPKPDPVLKKQLRGALADDARAIARILPVAQPIAAAMRALTVLLERFHLMDGDRILDLAPDGVTLLKQHYLALSNSHGADAFYLALAVTNRLARPYQILRLARALSWKPTETLVANTEFSYVGGRLIGDLQRLSREIVAMVSHRHRLPPAEDLGRNIGHYMEEAEALLNEIGFRRDSAWGEAILQTRNDLAAVLHEKLLQRFGQNILAMMPLAPRDGFVPDSAEARGNLEAALQSARLIQLLAQRGHRHGFAQAARETLNGLRIELERRANSVLGELKRDPDAVALRPQLEAVEKLFDVVFEEGRGALLLRQMSLALRASAPLQPLALERQRADKR
jgi:hypothetical protein